MVVFAEGGKPMIKVNELTSLFPDEDPFLTWSPDPISPGIIKYRNKGFDILLFDNRFQIQSRAVNSSIPSYFTDILQKVLQAAREHSIAAYGFNFDFTCSEIEEVKEIFKITKMPTSFTYRPNTSLRLTFEKNGIIFTFTLTDGKPVSKLHINVHHEETTKTDILAKEIANKLQEDFDNASMLINEVFADEENA